MLTPLLLSAALSTTSIALPGGPPAGMDYYAYDPAAQRLWVPAGNTGNVDVVDTRTGAVTPVSGFPTAPPKTPGRPNSGPSSATIGDGVVWVGNRADQKLCAIDSKTLEKRDCVQLPSSPDGLSWVGATHELWATTPRDKSLTIVGVGGKALAVSGTIKLDGAPEGYALDEARGFYFTNYEDKDLTLEIDLKSRKIVATWEPACGGDGPRGLSIDTAHRWLFVACSDGVVALDYAHGGRILGRLKTGGGVDAIDYDGRKRLLYLASGKDAKLTVAHVTDAGVPAVTESVDTVKGGRSVVIDGQGNAYIADSAGGRLIVVKPGPAATPK